MQEHRWVIALGMFFLVSCAPQGESQVERREVSLRVADQRHASDAAVAGSTADYPRVTIKDDTRLALPMFNVAGKRLQTSSKLAIPAGARMELAYGLEEPTAAPVAILVKAGSGAAEQILFNNRVGIGEPAGWTDLSLDLSAFEGDTQFSFEVLSYASNAGPPKVALSAPVIITEASGPPLRNVILISLDTLRADHMGIYGYQRDTSPKIDQLFSTEGVVVERTISQAADTFYGHLSIFTGMRPSTPLTFIPFGRTKLSKLSSWALTLPEVLRTAGYRTAAFTENALLMGGGVFNRGYEVYHEEKGVEGRTAETGGGGFAIPAAEGHIERTFGRGLEWIERHKDQPFFVFLHTYQVHTPYEPPAEYGHLFPTPVGSPRQRRELDLYDREIRYTDDQVAILVEKLRTMGVLDDTVLIITSDHGEEFGEHGAREHGASLKSEILHVPLLLRAPGLLPEGVRRTGPFGLLDLMPTLLDLLELKAPATVTGTSLVSHLVEGTPGNGQPLLSEARSPLKWTYGDFGLDPDWKGPGFSITAWPLRMVKEVTNKGPVYSLFHLDADPGELWNFYKKDRADLAGMRRQLDDYDKECERRRKELAAAMKVKAQPGDAAPVEMDDARKEKLRALGYIQ